MNKLFLFVRRNFLTVKFLSFGLIGVVNTMIHMGVYWIFYNLVLIPWLTEATTLVLAKSLSAFFANTIAFISASTFSYFANAFFTFKPKNRSTLQFSAVMAVFLIRLLISNLLTTGFDYAVQNWFGVNYEVYPWTSIIAPFAASVLLIPIAFFALDFVFRKTDQKKATNTTPSL